MNWLREQYREPATPVIHFAFIFATWLYSGMHVLSKPALSYVPPFVFATIRVLMGLPFMYLISRMEERVELTWADSGLLMVIGLVGIGVGQSVIFVVNQLVGAGILAMMIPLSTILTVVMSAILGMEKIGLLKAFVFNLFKGIGVTLTVAGSAAIARVTEKDFHSDTVWGVALMFLISIAAATYFILMGKFLKRRPIPMYAYFRASLWGLLLMLPLGALQLSDVEWAEIPNWVWPVEVYSGVVVSSGAHLIMSWLIKHCAAFLPAVYTSLQSVTTVVLATLILGESFNVWSMLCMCTILCGLFLVIVVRVREEKQASLVSSDTVDDQDENQEEGAKAPLLPVHSISNA
ncbi:hypothetical protein BSKO_02898 [Bryopsis sp. KO-2023]|nr:hypothetical protein BSKO_02898 [Bryopsis sp. KO-2023]